jgi:hypothetical protein
MLLLHYSIDVQFTIQLSQLHERHVLLKQRWSTIFVSSDKFEAQEQLATRIAAHHLGNTPVAFRATQPPSSDICLLISASNVDQEFGCQQPDILSYHAVGKPNSLIGTDSMESLEPDALLFKDLFLDGAELAADECLNSAEDTIVQGHPQVEAGESFNNIFP